MKKLTAALFLIVAFIIPLSLLLSFSYCHRDGSEAAVPRRYAYPRVEPLDTATVACALGGVEARISASARCEEGATERPGWLTAAYPGLGATLYLSAARTPDTGAALANRRQRISLNLGGTPARTDRFDTAAGYAVELVTCPDGGVTTPVQFVAVGEGTVVSGAFVLHGTLAPADSLRPVVDALAAEAFRIAASLR